MSLHPANYEEALARKQASGARKRSQPRTSLKRTKMVVRRVSKKATAKRFQTLRAGSIWSQAVRSRDDHRCQRCGKRDEHNNHAHHVAPRSRRPDLKSILSNGKTVCPACHDWIHRNPREAEVVGLLSFETYEAAMKL